MTSENEYTDDAGVQYVAQKASFGCRGCAHEDTNGYAHISCLLSKTCLSERRSDGENIIWIKAENGSQA